MLKFLLAIASIGAGTALGIYKSNSYKRRVELLGKIELLLLRIKTYFSNDRITTERMFSLLDKTDTFDDLTFVRCTSEKLKGNPDFKSAFTKSLDESKSELALKDDDYAALYNLSDVIGSYDSETVLRELDLAQSIIVGQRAQAESEYQKNGKLYRMLYILSGIALAILII